MSSAGGSGSGPGPCQPSARPTLPLSPQMDPDKVSAVSVHSGKKT
jgi:hypothetical protein